MVTEDYVSFEIAKLLKDKGFDEPTIAIYYKDGTFEYFSLNKWNTKFITPISAPTLQMAMKWLRRIYSVNIDIVSVWNQKRFEYQVFIVTPENAKHCYVDDKLYLGYEEAVEAALKYVLENLI